jgi:gliding motility-associated-like protein
MNLVFMVYTIRIYSMVMLLLAMTCPANTQIGPQKNLYPAVEENSHFIKIDFNKYLLQAKGTDNRSPLFFDLPLQNVSYQIKAVPNYITDAEFSRLYPDIYTYDFTCENDQNINGTITISSTGVYFTIRQSGKLITIYPSKNPTDKDLHYVDYGKTQNNPLTPYCGSNHIDHNTKKPFFKSTGGLRSDISIGERKYNYRMAVVATGEFYLNNGNNDTEVMTAVVNSVNSLNAIFNNELSFKFTLGNRIYLFKDPATDPFLPDMAGGVDRTQQAGIEIPKVIDINSFDIAHVFHTHKQGDNWTTGGLANFNSVCSSTKIENQFVKASGWSGSFNNKDVFWTNLLAHEVGHQFGATHTFNGSGQECDNTIDSGTAVEIGSGSTIMSYFGACESTQNIPWAGAVDNYFHAISLEQMYRYVYQGAGGNCAGPLISQNKIPQVEANPCMATLTIPKSTPFFLKARGTWTDTDIHTYSWEQIDEDGSGIKPTQGQIGAAAANSLKSPLFRSFPPSVNSFRYFPSLDVLNSASGSSPFEVLPAIARELNFNVSIRDNNPDGGAISNDELTIQVVDAGPLQITKPTGGETLLAGQTELLTWNTNGSNTLCNKARIRMSTDSGKTFPLIIAENVVYASGSFAYNIPQNFVSTTNAKIMVECMDYDCFTFFDISDATFRINSSCAPNESILCTTDSLKAEKGSETLNLNMPAITGLQLNSLSKTLKVSDPLGNVSVFTNDFNACKTVSTSNYFQKSKIAVTKTGTYKFRIDGGGFVSIFSPNFTASSGCNGFVSSSARESLTPGINRSSTWSVDLRSCTDYEVVFYSFGQLPVTVSLITESGPGIVFEPSTSLPNGYEHVFLLVDKVSGNIVKAGSSTDFRTTLPGSYTLFSSVIPTSVNNNTLLNQQYSQVLQTACISRQLNNRDITILPTCEIKNIIAGAQTACVPSNNLYTQTLTLTYENPPSTGKININGQLFDITTSPQNVILAGLDSDSKPVNITAFFTSEETCVLRKPNLFTAPAECCPIPLELGPPVVRCEQSGTVKLEAGTNPNFIYIWSKDGQLINSNQGGVLFVTSTGLYGVQVKHPNGCSKSDTVRVIFNPLPQVTLRDGISFCENEKYILEAVVSPTDTITWLRNDTIIQGATSNKLEISKSGIYKITVKNTYGCISRAETTIQTIKAPKPDLGPNLAKCEGDNVVLNAGNDGISYQWYKDNTLVTSGANIKQYTVTNSGTYKVIVTNVAQCMTEDQVKIDFFSAPAIESFPQTVNGCQGSPLSIEAKVTDYFSLQWYYNNNPIGGTNTLKIPVNNSGSYSIEATNLAGCRTRKSTNVLIRSLPSVNLGPDIVICERTPVLLFAGTEGILYEWSRNDIKLNNPENTLSVLEGGLYKVSVTNNFNCRAVVQKSITYVTGPPVNISNDTFFCDGLNHTIKVSTTATDAKYQWFRNTEPISGNGPELNVTEPGNYEAWVTAGSPACTTIKGSIITVHPKPAFNLGNDRVLCDPTDFPVLNGGPSNTQFQWSFNGTSISSNRTVTADKSGTYALKVKNSFGCERTEQVKITISSNPALSLSGDTILCEGNDLTISSQTNGTKFIWRRNNINIPNASLNTYIATMPGIYTLVSANDVDCRTEKNINVVSRPKPVVTLGSDTSLCPGSTLTLNAGTHSSFLWSNGYNGATLNINSGNPSANTITKYIVTVTNEFKCSSKDSVIVTLIAAVKADIIASNSTLCKGDSITLTASGGQNFKWSETGNNTLTTPTLAKTIAKPTSNTIYTVEVSNSACPSIKDIKSIEVKLFGTTPVDAGRDTCTISGRQIKLNASGGVKYQWNNSGSITGPTDIPNPTIVISDDTRYLVTITDSNGCKYVDSVKICIKAAEVKAITAITPNNDGKNDELVFPGLEVFPGNKLTIFNRWGTVIFEAKDYQINGILFKGERNGERLPADTYYYILQYDKKIIKSALLILWD